MSIDKGQTSNVCQLSRGEIPDGAGGRYCPSPRHEIRSKLENPLHGDGVVPRSTRWTCICTHNGHAPSSSGLPIPSPTVGLVRQPTPAVISGAKEVLVYSLDNGGTHRVPSLYGRDANSVLLEGDGYRCSPMSEWQIPTQ